ncbi:MAG: aldose epimerase family protein [Salegentibacter sp.]
MENKTKQSLKMLSLVNKRRTELKIMNYGAAILSLKMKDKHQKEINVIVSPKPEEFLTADYWERNQCFGASIGRYAGRISEGKFKIGKEEYSLYQKDGVHLHGGEFGFQYKFWSFQEENSGENPSVKLQYVSPDGEEGYPGKLTATVKYTLTEKDEVLIEYTATTDKKTVVNLTNHAYFNLNGNGSVSDHFLQIKAKKMLEVNEKQLPTGNLVKLKGNPKDYRENKLIGNRHLDDVYVLATDEEEVAAQLFSPLTGVKMELRTNQPAMVAYAPESLPEEFSYTTNFAEYPSICLEAQNFPDAPNFRNFPSSVLEPGKVYQNRISLQFSVKE